MNRQKILTTCTIVVAASTINSCAVHGQTADISTPYEQQYTRHLQGQIAWQQQQIDVLRQTLGSQTQRIVQLELLLRGVRFNVTSTMVQVLPEHGFGD